MKKLITIVITLIMVITSMGVWGCGKTPPPDEASILVDVKDLTTYDVADLIDDQTKALIEAETSPVTYKLISVATGTEFVFESTVIDLSTVHKEYYLIEVYNSVDDEVFAIDENQEKIVNRVDFHDVTTDGVVSFFVTTILLPNAFEAGKAVGIYLMEVP